jgi:predicted SAM-dependent methyltransferase
MISIVIPCYNQHDMAHECLEAIRENTSNYEIIIVDNGSTPPYLDATIRNEANLGFPVAINQGIKAARGDIICLLNNDVIVTPGWADRLMSGLEKYSIVGPVTNYCAGLQRTVVGSYSNSVELYSQAKKYGENHKGECKDANWIIGFLFMFRKQLYNEIGEFDESLWPCSGEELDFCMRAKKNGHNVGIIKDCYVHHEGSKTFQLIGLDYNELCKRNDEHLKVKWGKNIWLDQVSTNGNGSRLNIGCGRFRLVGFVNIDQDKEVRPDLVANALSLPYKPNTIDEIYAGHILEHLDWREGEMALWHWYNVLRPGGKIAISVPDYDVLCRQYINDPTPAKLREFNDSFIYSYGQKSPHKYAYSKALLFQTMEKAGFADLECMPADHPYFPHEVSWQAGVQGRKPNTWTSSIKEKEKGLTDEAE